MNFQVLMGFILLVVGLSLLVVVAITAATWLGLKGTLVVAAGLVCGAGMSIAGGTLIKESKT